MSKRSKAKHVTGTRWSHLEVVNEALDLGMEALVSLGLGEERSVAYGTQLAHQVRGVRALAHTAVLVLMVVVLVVVVMLVVGMRAIAVH